MDLQLIELVSKKPLLYDKTNCFYRHPPLKEQAWLEIAGNLGINVEKVKKRWVCLRDQFCRELRRKGDPLQHSKSMRKFRHFERLYFLKESYTPRKPCSILENEENWDTFIEKPEEETLPNMEQNTFSTSEELSAPDSMLDVTRNEEPPITETSIAHELRKVVDKSKKEKSLELDDEDDIRFFTANLEKLIRLGNFSIAERVNLQIKILLVVQEYLDKK